MCATNENVQFSYFEILQVIFTITHLLYSCHTGNYRYQKPAFHHHQQQPVPMQTQHHNQMQTPHQHQFINCNYDQFSMNQSMYSEQHQPSFISSSYSVINNHNNVGLTSNGDRPQHMTTNLTTVNIPASYTMNPNSYQQEILQPQIPQPQQTHTILTTSSTNNNVNNDNINNSINNTGGGSIVFSDNQMVAKQNVHSGGSSTAESVGSLQSDNYDTKTLLDSTGTVKKRRKPAPTIATGRRNLKDESVSMEEAERRDKRRERNRKSAQRCRERKIEKKEALQRELGTVTNSCRNFLELADRIIDAWKQRVLLLEDRLPGHQYESHISLTEFENAILLCKRNMELSCSNSQVQGTDEGVSSSHSMEPSPHSGPSVHSINSSSNNCNNNNHNLNNNNNLNIHSNYQHNTAPYLSNSSSCEMFQHNNNFLQDHHIGYM